MGSTAKRGSSSVTRFLREHVGPVRTICAEWLDRNWKEDAVSGFIDHECESVCIGKDSHSGLVRAVLIGMFFWDKASRQNSGHSKPRRLGIGMTTLFAKEVSSTKS
jgi:hypothetical protein